MEKQEKVIDASVIVKWFLNEENSDKARELRTELTKEDLVLIVPDLMFLEVLNTLRYKRAKKDALIKANKILFELGLKIEKIDKETLIKTIENSVKYNITVYDALYVSMAQLHNASLITADSKLYKIPNVIALGKI
ncbi:type II toxin-antitoxin system VapC family toxin [Candidatus Pacearchaeota archaeon]|nr:type II toxin-antitoxin system VapC family toxin [Candidatus Pacearchaeota archaeon]